MGNVITSLKRKRSYTDREISIRGSDSNINSRNGSISRQASTSVTVSGSGSCNEDQKKKRKKGNGIKNKYSFIPDNFKTLEEVHNSFT
ncbi:hypothetical protein Pint_17274 [Pistacia integerrima]|uniref:Uncharacterized protein n=1 Tax=Pistacia integerrima TaxID=434235 RepID=A0ACC0YUQ0_9ROSI|nr:hypothetical protein Pint_17274 [Pistacia integerrima]